MCCITSNLMLCFLRDGQCPEYSGEEQAICAVGLAKSKPGVFVEAIQYLLILATPVEVLTIFCFYYFQRTCLLKFCPSELVLIVIC